MITSVYISNESIFVLVGKASSSKIVVNKIIISPLEEGVIINGVITNDYALKKKVEEIWRVNKLPNKNLKLIIDSALVSIKVIDAPRLPEKKLLKFVQGEFSEIEDKGEMVFDYSVISLKNESGGVKLLGCSAEKEYIEAYMDIFNSVKLDVDKIDISLDTLIKMFSFIKIYRSKTFVITIIDKNTAAQAFFVNGQYSFYKRFRIVSERGSEDFFNEIGRSLSSMVQFNKSEKTGYDITDMYFCGLTESEEGFCTAWSETAGCAVSKLPESQQISFSLKRKVGLDKPHLSDLLYLLGNVIENK